MAGNITQADRHTGGSHIDHIEPVAAEFRRVGARSVGDRNLQIGELQVRGEGMAADLRDQLVELVHLGGSGEGLCNQIRDQSETSTGSSLEHDGLLPSDRDGADDLAIHVPEGQCGSSG